MLTDVGSPSLYVRIIIILGFVGLGLLLRLGSV